MAEDESDGSECPDLACTSGPKNMVNDFFDSGHSIILIDELIMECHCHRFNLILI